MRFKVRVVTDLVVDFDSPATEADARAVAETCLTAPRWRGGFGDAGPRVVEG
jgi:hypothetical protein